MSEAKPEGEIVIDSLPQSKIKDFCQPPHQRGPRTAISFLSPRFKRGLYCPKGQNKKDRGKPPLSFHYECKKGPNLSVEALLLSAISFRLPSDSISAAASFRLTLVVRFRFQPLWAVRFTAFTASLPLSDPLCFGILSSASVSGSDYSASVLPFLLFPIPPHSGFLGAPLPLSLLGLSPFSPTWFPMSSFRLLVLSSAVRFLSPFPASLPQLFHRCLPSALAFGIFHFRSASFRPHPFRFRLLSLLFFLSFSSRFRLTAAFPVPASALASSVSPFSPT